MLFLMMFFLLFVLFFAVLLCSCSCQGCCFCNLGSSCDSDETLWCDFNFAKNLWCDFNPTKNPRRLESHGYGHESFSTKQINVWKRLMLNSHVIPWEPLGQEIRRSQPYKFKGVDPRNSELVTR